jgi:fucose permease
MDKMGKQACCNLDILQFCMKKTNYSALTVLVLVFFFWGFVAASNDILIPVFKEKLKLEQYQAQMISFAFYVAYTVGSLLDIKMELSLAC